MKALIVLLLASASLLAADTNQLPSRPGLEIDAEFAEFRLKDGVFYYSNNVVVTDPPAEPGLPATVLRCHELTATRDETGKFESIVALHFVQIDQGQDQARGQRAVYTRSNEWMVLTGAFDPADTNYPRPYLRRGADMIDANRIVYDRASGKLFFDQQRTRISDTTLSKGDTNASPTNKSGKPKPQFPFPTK